MAGLSASTYNFIASQTLSNSTTTTVTFNNIPQNYTDLKIVVKGKCTTSGANAVSLQFNGDSSGNYSRTILNSDGSTSSSSRASNQSYINAGTIANTTQNPSSVSIDIFNYSSPNKYKTTLSKCSWVEGPQIIVGMWRSYNPITSVSLPIDQTYGACYYTSGATITVYGIKAADTTAIIPTKASGGDAITTDGTYTYHVFNSTGTFVPYSSLSCDYLVIAGGGGGGVGGGGGAGGFRTGTSLSTTANTTYAVTVGAGGPGSFATSSSRGTSGSNSVFSTITSTGGGYGATYGVNEIGGSGGSGGGGGQYNASTTLTGGTGNTPSTSPSQGNNGGTGVYSGVNTTRSGGGGGGASSSGTNGSGGTGGNGGSGTSSTFYLGIANTYAGGGGAFGGTTAGSGGSGGGGNGGYGVNDVDTGIGFSGLVNTGSGGGGANYYRNSGQGGSGLVIVRYAN